MSDGISGPGAQLKNSEGVKNFLPEFTNYHKHGELYVPENGGLAVVLTTAGTYYTATGFTEGLESPDDYIDLDGTNGTITIGDKGAGLYRVDIGASFDSSRANVEIHGDCFLNGVDLANVGWIRDIGTANAIGNASDWGHVLLVPDDVLTYRLESDVNATTITLRHATLSLMWIAGEE